MESFIYIGKINLFFIYNYDKFIFIYQRIDFDIEQENVELNNKLEEQRNIYKEII